MGVRRLGTFRGGKKLQFERSFGAEVVGENRKLGMSEFT